jgi:hypothetical protein
VSEAELSYLGIKALSKELRRPASTLFALSAGNDPFYITPARTAAAEWFAEQWHRLNIPSNWHYRRIHYVFVSQDGVTLVVMLSGKPYENTLECWAELCEAARDAIALELVPQDAFADHRNAEPIIYLVEPQSGGADISNGYPDCFVPEFPPLPSLTFDRPVVPQPYHVEVWAEKTTVNDVLDPLARQYRFNLVTGIGELSATRCREFVDRAERNSGRPVRILYVSDFDPGGLSMPVAVARKIEFELYRRGLNLDVQLRPIVLTLEQCIEHRLPRTPIKETERRGKRFEERFGEGGTELDALEALHPGLLRRIGLNEVSRYWNPDHATAVAETCERIEEQFDEITADAHDAHQGEIAALKADWQRIVANIEAWKSRAKPTWQAIPDYLEEAWPSLGYTRWSPEFVTDEDPDPLFDSTRDYLEQIDRYKRHQGKPTARKTRANGGGP